MFYVQLTSGTMWSQYYISLVLSSFICGYSDIYFLVILFVFVFYLEYINFFKITMFYNFLVCKYIMYTCWSIFLLFLYLL